MTYRLAMKTIFTSAAITFLAIIFYSCKSSMSAGLSRVVEVSIPGLLKGDFIDDYGVQYRIDDSVWVQFPQTRYHILMADTVAQYLIARNDKGNPDDQELYTRIDYMMFDNMRPFLWGFCLTEYKAKSMEEAINKAAADRQNPREGCNGFPFSRMKKR